MDALFELCNPCAYPGIPATNGGPYLRSSTKDFAAVPRPRLLASSVCAFMLLRPSRELRDPRAWLATFDALLTPTSIDKNGPDAAFLSGCCARIVQGALLDLGERVRSAPLGGAVSDRSWLPHVLAFLPHDVVALILVHPVFCASGLAWWEILAAAYAEWVLRRDGAPTEGPAGEAARAHALRHLSAVPLADREAAARAACLALRVR